MKNMSIILPASIMLMLFSYFARASTATLDFPSNSSIYDGPSGPGMGAIAHYSLGDYVTQTFNTNLAYTSGSIWKFQIGSDIDPSVVNTFDININGQKIGGFSFSNDNRVFEVKSFDLQYHYTPIWGNDYKLDIVATSTVPVAKGLWYWRSGTVTLDGAVSSVPESEKWAMMLLGFPLIGWVAHRKRAGTKQPPAKAGGFMLRTESPDTRRLYDAS